MRKTVLLLGMALIASSAMMGQVVNRNMAAAITSENAELVLDSVVTKTRETECESCVRIRFGKAQSI